MRRRRQARVRGVTDVIRREMDGEVAAGAPPEMSVTVAEERCEESIATEEHEGELSID